MMKAEIRERIEQVRRGEVPKGYRRTRAGIMPETWINNDPLRAGNIFKNYSNKNHDGNYEIMSATQDRGIIPRTEVNIDIKYAEENILGYKKVDVGDFVISLRSFQGGIEYSEHEGLVSPAYTVLKSIRAINSGYYKAYFKTEDFISRLNAAVYGIRDGKQIGYEDFGDIILHYPPISEQEKIAEILTHCDQVIELKNQVIKEKRRQKKWLMQNLLDPLSGIRLPGFKGNWIRTKIGHITKVLTGATPSTTIPEYWGGDIPWMSSGELNNKHIHNVVGRITESGLNNSGTKMIPISSVLIGLAGQGKTRGTVAINHIELCTNQSIGAILPSQKHVSEYLYHNLDNRYDELRKISSGDRQRGGLNLELIKNIALQMPTIEEQTAITEVLSTADREIDLLEQERTQWQTKKKALMQLLLTGLVRVN